MTPAPWSGPLGLAVAGTAEARRTNEVLGLALVAAWGPLVRRMFTAFEAARPFAQAIGILPAAPVAPQRPDSAGTLPTWVCMAHTVPVAIGPGPEVQHADGPRRDSGSASASGRFVTGAGPGPGRPGDDGDGDETA
ncbi:L-asparaginase [Streptomyces lydicamycinicus]|uniref:L-asparaginase n=1 Tax=Streptomyces lydicamycinicus TaxID=1546107 RepID=A0A0P4RGT2_9ACTN|nr:L-asparaginase [Streptomyces lydicamycinicus]